MQYKVLNKRGIIITRQPEVVTDKLTVTFTGAPENATAVFKSSAGTVYRTLQENACSIPVRILAADTEVVLTVLDGKAKPPVYRCEGLKTQTLASGESVVMPNDMDLPNIVTQIQQDIQDTNDRLSELETKYLELEKKLNGLINRLQTPQRHKEAET